MQGRQIGHYEVDSKLGEGGVGEVYRAFDHHLGRAVAIKRLRPELRSREDIVARFRAEAQTLAPLNHPNVGILYGLEEDGDELLMVMELVQGESLAALLMRHGPLEIADALEIWGQAIDGLCHVHESGVVHRDIKAANLILSRDGRVKIMDFGIAHVLGSDRMTQVGQLIGTPEFMSPEQVRGDVPDARSDLYAMGILLFYLLTGRLPFRAAAQFDVMRAQMDVDADPPLCHPPFSPGWGLGGAGRLLAEDREDRFQSAEEVRDLLTEQLAGDGERPTLARLIPPTPTGVSDDLSPTAAWLTAVPMEEVGCGAPEGAGGLEQAAIEPARPLHGRAHLFVIGVASLVLLLGANWLQHDGRAAADGDARRGVAARLQPSLDARAERYDRPWKRARTADEAGAPAARVGTSLASQEIAASFAASAAVVDEAQREPGQVALGVASNDHPEADGRGTRREPGSGSESASEAGRNARAQPNQPAKAAPATKKVPTRQVPTKKVPEKQLRKNKKKKVAGHKKAPDESKPARARGNEKGWMIRR